MSFRFNIGLLNIIGFSQEKKTRFENLNPIVAKNWANRVYNVSPLTIGDKLIQEVIDANVVDNIAKNFFQQSCSRINVTNKSLLEGVWFVKVLVISFGKESSKTLAIESKTGRVISVE